MSHPSRHSVLFEGLISKPVQVAFDTDLQSSDGGGLLLGALDRKLGLTERLATCFADPRDAAVLGGDPVLQTICGRRPGEASRLGSQPTLSRFERTPTRHELHAATLCLEEQVLGSLRKKHPQAKLITVDFDGTHDPVHGAQQLALFHGFYDCTCYLPLLGFLTIDDHAQQWLFHTRLRSGKARQAQAVIPLLRRVVPQLKRAFPRARIRVRLDGGFATPRILAELERLKVQYVVGMPGNKALEHEVAEQLDYEAAMAELTGETRRCFDSFPYRANSWPHARRVVAKVEAVVHAGREVKRNPRFVVSNLPHRPEKVYDLYCGRGDSENRIKELKDDLEIDRTSCSSFRANAFRVLQAAAAYTLFQELRWKLRRTKMRRAQAGTLRLRLLKIGVRVVVSARRVLLHAPKHWPWLGNWLQAARVVGGVSA